MPRFTYTARDRSGNPSSGIIEADSNSGAAALLRERGLWVTALQAEAGPRDGTTRRAPEEGVAKKLFSPISLRDLALFYRQFHTLLNAGMPLYQSIATLGETRQTPNAHLRRVLAEMGQMLLAGTRLSEGMSRYPWLFDRMQVRMVEAGEQGGMLVEILDRLARYLEREYELRLEVKRKTLYPKLLLVAVIFIPAVPTLVLAGPLAYVREIWAIIWRVVVFGVPLFYAARLFVRTRAGRDLWDTVKLALPLTGSLVRKMAAARFARTLAALYGAGVPISQALGLAGEACGNSVLERASTRMRPAVERGCSVSQTLEATGFFPPMFVGMVATGESTGNLDEMLEKAADYYEEESKHATVQLVTILGVALLLVMGLMVAIKVISFWTGYFGGLLGGSAGGGGIGE